ncbi:hypothetical protein Salat_1194000 [Sesamum alatum]|uniref:Uncharacterized protein n=1 Tax=Sesamum alatum TaxID=300844 RepID=A0AAE1YEZ6_9LAMI|nr:hypothetical protein Salat_1194000 [Sesamum alatum]
MDRIAVERAIREAREKAFVEARERAERAVVDRAATEVRQRVLAEAREMLEKASVVKQWANKASTLAESLDDDIKRWATRKEKNGPFFSKIGLVTLALDLDCKERQMMMGSIEFQKLNARGNEERIDVRHGGAKGINH